MNIESLSISELRHKAAQLRERADAIDAAISSLEASVGGLVGPATRVDMPLQARSRSVDVTVTRKGKQPGSVSQKWKAVLWEMAQMQHPTQGISSAGIAEIVLRKLGQTKRPAELARQFAPYSGAGYIVKPFDDRYLVTDKGKAKIGYIPASESMFADNSGYVADTSSPSQEGESESGALSDPFNNLLR